MTVARSCEAGCHIMEQLVYVCILLFLCTAAFLPGLLDRGICEQIMRMVIPALLSSTGLFFCLTSLAP